MDKIEFNAYDINYNNIREFIDGTIYLDLNIVKKTDTKEIEKLIKIIKKYQYNVNYDIKVNIKFIKKEVK